MARFYVGTSGWHYPHWRGVFYPEDLPSRQWLSHYAQRFPPVELNARPPPHPRPGRTGGAAGARPLRRPPPRRPPRPAALPAATRFPPHAGERLAAGGVPGPPAGRPAARRRGPPSLLVRRRDGGAPPAARRGVLLLRHGGARGPAAGDRAVRLFPLPRLRGGVGEQLHC